MGNKLSIFTRIKAGLLIGGLGFSLWEGSFAPMDWIVRFLATVSPTFRDSLYREATKGYDSMHAVVNFTILAMMVVVLGYFGLWGANYLYRRFSGRDHSLALFDFPKRHLIFNAIAILVVMGTLIVNLQLSYSKRVIAYSMDSIEVLAPDIPNATRLRLRLDFFCMRNADDFYLLNEKLNKLSETTGKQLPTFNPI